MSNTRTRTINGIFFSYRMNVEGLERIYIDNMSQYYENKIFEKIPFEDGNTIYVTVLNSVNQNNYLIKYKIIKFREENIEGEFEIKKPTYIYPLISYFSYSDFIRIYGNNPNYVHFLDKKEQLTRNNMNSNDHMYINY